MTTDGCGIGAEAHKIEAWKLKIHPDQNIPSARRDWNSK
jgi:hypothetical protein